MTHADPGPEAPAPSRPDRGTTARTRELGASLRRAREHAGWTQPALARRFGWSLREVAASERGHRETSAIQASVWLAGTRVPGDEYRRVAALALLADDGYRLQSHPVHFPERLPTLRFLDATAQALIVYHPGVVPPLVQAPGYTKTDLRRKKLLSDQVVWDRVGERRARYTFLSRHPGPEVTIYIDEAALHDPVFGKVMHEQLGHLWSVACHPHWNVRIVPPDTVDNDLATAFTVYHDHESNAVVTAHTPTAMLVLESTDDLATYTQIVGDLQAAALSDTDATARYLKPT